MEEAAGFILYCDEGGRRWLLLRNARHGTWGFPKGKLEPGEDARTAARRELLEETGISEVDEDPEFVVDSVYVPRRPADARGPERDDDAADDADDDPDDEARKKRVRYFLARAPRRDFRRSAEHDAADWMTAEEATATLRHDDLRRALRDAMRRVRRA